MVLVPSSVSLMPEKLLDTLSYAEIADLFAYLGSDAAPKKAGEPGASAPGVFVSGVNGAPGVSGAGGVLSGSFMLNPCGRIPSARPIPMRRRAQGELYAPPVKFSGRGPRQPVSPVGAAPATKHAGFHQGLQDLAHELLADAPPGQDHA